MNKPELLLLGGHNSGKTHYAGQLYGRLTSQGGCLCLREEQGTPQDLSAVEGVLSALYMGHAANHTPRDTSTEVVLPLRNAQGRALDLHWPDYGGEQLSSIFDERSLTEAWRQRLLKSEAWVLLLRLQSETTYPDELEKLLNREELKEDSQTRPAASSGKWDANAYWVELLQLLLHVAGRGTVERLRRPRLAVLLSCYDEIPEPKSTPSQTLAAKLPLLSSFIHSVWAVDDVSIWGLSALGKPLEQDSEDKEFRTLGPEEQGWVIAPEGGEHDKDLTRPLAWLLESL